ncbi:putative protein pelota [Monocercomonoides exilis]|uniref:putative protein pelota n=1 Tax=Monocercomonoides exilis TaxID=2049356 RepID=UPI0035599AFD|nr:putative protein pelota [Monocercomonoides exilis]|eukprot:MONOS_3878.1-p1 / transcript=MONOS_3878.1 / gene=MONOS_3878 / organism=Monocercomonoides_exilis_PA203 / gene_product=pelota homolog / transcript_product=pelota homolog / location=Mono_scaffold00095:104081-106303(-) / protein_length=595 / sequence_SO=supercontig / SO=protein_coding / is_pseudo=false
MKILHRSIQRNGAGTVNLIPETDDDLWHAFNLIQIGDCVSTKTMRRVKLETQANATRGERVPVFLKIAVTSSYFNGQELELRIKGTIRDSHQLGIQNGSSHTLVMQTGRNFVLEKYKWDDLYLDRLREATEAPRSADIGIVVMQEGIAHVCVVKNSVTIEKAKVVTNIPRKASTFITRMGGSGSSASKGGSDMSSHSKGINRFFYEVLSAMNKAFNYDLCGNILIGSPGFVKDDFLKQVLVPSKGATSSSPSTGSFSFTSINADLYRNKHKIVAVHCSSGHRHAVQELLSSPAVASLLSGNKASHEETLMQEMMRLIAVDTKKVSYGLEHVRKCVAVGAVKDLLVSEALLRQVEGEKRAVLMRMMRDVGNKGGKVHLFSDMNAAGEQLNQLGGVAAILRYEMEEDEEEEEAERESHSKAAGSKEKEERKKSKEDLDELRFVVGRGARGRGVWSCGDERADSFEEEGENEEYDDGKKKKKDGMKGRAGEEEGAEESGWFDSEFDMEAFISRDIWVLRDAMCGTADAKLAAIKEEEEEGDGGEEKKEEKGKAEGAGKQQKQNKKGKKGGEKALLSDSVDPSRSAEEIGTEILDDFGF